MSVSPATTQFPVRVFGGPRPLFRLLACLRFLTDPTSTPLLLPAPPGAPALTKTAPPTAPPKTSVRRRDVPPPTTRHDDNLDNAGRALLADITHPHHHRRRRTPSARRPPVLPTGSPSSWTAPAAAVGLTRDRAVPAIHGPGTRRKSNRSPDRSSASSWTGEGLPTVYVSGDNALLEPSARSPTLRPHRHRDPLRRRTPLRGDLRRRTDRPGQRRSGPPRPLETLGARRVVLRPLRQLVALHRGPHELEAAFTAAGLADRPSWLSATSPLPFPVGVSGSPGAPRPQTPYRPLLRCAVVKAQPCFPSWTSHAPPRGHSPRHSPPRSNGRTMEPHPAPLGERPCKVSPDPGEERRGNLEGMPPPELNSAEDGLHRLRASAATALRNACCVARVLLVRECTFASWTPNVASRAAVANSRRLSSPWTAAAGSSRSSPATEKPFLFLASPFLLGVVSARGTHAFVLQYNRPL